MLEQYLPTSTVISGQMNISGSTQITTFGFISGSDLNSLNSYTSSTDTRIDGIDTVTHHSIVD